MEKSCTAAAIYSRKWRKENPERYLKIGRESAWRFKGINVEEASKLREALKYCYLCEGESDLCIDHDHKTGKIRGVLCKKHNLALGLFNDSPTLLRRAADYLEDKDVNYGPEVDKDGSYVYH